MTTEKKWMIGAGVGFVAILLISGIGMILNGPTKADPWVNDGSKIVKWDVQQYNHRVIGTWWFDQYPDNPRAKSFGYDTKIDRFAGMVPATNAKQRIFAFTDELPTEAQVQTWAKKLNVTDFQGNFPYARVDDKPFIPTKENIQAYAKELAIADLQGSLSWSRVSDQPSIPSRSDVETWAKALNVADLQGQLPWSRISSQPSIPTRSDVEAWAKALAIKDLQGNLSYARIDDKPTIPAKLDDLSDIQKNIADGKMLKKVGGVWTGVDAPVGKSKLCEMADMDCSSKAPQRVVTVNNQSNFTTTDYVDLDHVDSQTITARKMLYTDAVMIGGLKGGMEPKAGTVKYSGGWFYGMTDDGKFHRFEMAGAAEGLPSGPQVPWQKILEAIGCLILLALAIANLIMFAKLYRR